MTGILGNFLRICEVLGLFVQRAIRAMLQVLVGSSAKNWTLETLPVGQSGAKIQRAIRELLGFVVLVAMSSLIARLIFGGSSEVSTITSSLMAVFFVSIIARMLLE